MEDNIISAHKLLVHSNEYKKTNALNILYAFILFAASLGTRFLMEHFKNNGMEFADNSLPGIVYFITPGLAIIFGLIITAAPISMLRSFYFDILEIYPNSIQITNITKNERKIITYDKFTLIPVIGKKNGNTGFLIDIKRVTLKRSEYYFSDFENPQELETNLRKFACWKETK